MLQQLLMLFGFFALVLALIFWINRALSLLDWLMADGQSPAVFFELTVLSLPGLLANLLPIAAFAATVYATNRLSSESEMVVVQAAGYSPYRLARPALIFGIMATIMLAILTHVLVPLAQRELSIRRTQIASDVTSRLLTEGVFIHPAENVTFYVREISPAGELEEIYLSDASDPETRQSFTAARALIVRDDDGPMLLMFDGMSQIYQTQNKRLSVTRFDSFAYSLGDFIGTPQVPRQRLRTTSSAQLLTGSPALFAELGATRAERFAEIAARSNLALQSLAVTIVGFAALIVGGFSRFGLWRQVLLALVLLVIVKSIDNTLEGIVDKNALLWPLRFAATLGGILAGYALLWKAAHPVVFKRKGLT